MRNPRPPEWRPGARDNFDAGNSFGNDTQVFINFRAPLQVIPETAAEALAFGYGLPPADHLTACRAMWWRLWSHGVPLPAERRVILFAGGVA